MFARLHPSAARNATAVRSYLHSRGCTRSGMRHQRAHYGSIAWGAGKDDCVSYATCRARWNFLGSKWPDAARQITTLCKFRFSLSLSLLLPSSRGDSRERRFTIHLGPGEEKKEKEWTRHGIFFGRDRTGPKYGRPFEGREAA